VDVYIVRHPRFGSLTPEILEDLAARIPVNRVDVIHIQHEYGLYKALEGGFYGALARLGRPVVTTMHAVGNWDIDRVVCQTSTRVIVHNEFCARRLEHPSVIIPHGCIGPIECPPPDECKRALGIDPRAPIVGYCGFISSYKNLEVLIDAMTEVKEAALLIGGGWHVEPGTDYISRLKQRSFSLLPGRCQWLGWVPDERLATVYGAMDVVVYPSRYISESGALLMALSHGKAVIASDLPPVREKKGALTTFKDVDDLRRKIRRVLRDPRVRRRLERGALRYARAASWPRVAETHLTLYRDILQEGG